MADRNYTKFDNDYLSYLSTLDLNGAEFRVLLFILRQTACYKRTFTKDCAHTFIMNGTHLSEKSVRRAIDSLIKKGYIEICNQASGQRPYSYKIRVVMLGNLGGQVWSHKVVKVDHSTGTKLTTKEITEDNNKKITEKRETSSPSSSLSEPNVSLMTAKEFAEYVRSLPDDEEDEEE